MDRSQTLVVFETLRYFYFRAGPRDQGLGSQAASVRLSEP